MREVVVANGCRTPFQKAVTGFADRMSYELAAAVIRALVERAGIAAADVDRVIVGATVHNPRTTNVAREAALAAGLPATVPALTLTAAGASATAAIAYGADLIATGQADVVIAGGSDCISDPPIAYRRAMRKKLLGARRIRSVGQALRFALTLRPGDVLPDLPDITEFSTGKTMGQYTEQLARELGIGRPEQDAYAVSSHERAAAARQNGFLDAEIVPIAGASGEEVRADNGIRADTTLTQMERLPPSFDKDGGTLTAGNSTFLTDGAAGVVLMARELFENRSQGGGAAVLRGSRMTAHDPAEELLLGPAYAIPLVLDEHGLGLDDIDVFEIHEAFAAQILAVERLLGSDDFARRHLGREQAVGELCRNKLNAWGGSLAIGNPFAPNGARLVTTAVHRLAREGGRFALVATCAGGGLGHALLLERPVSSPPRGRVG